MAGGPSPRSPQAPFALQSSGYQGSDGQEPVFRPRTIAGAPAGSNQSSAGRPHSGGFKKNAPAAGSGNRAAFESCSETTADSATTTDASDAPAGFLDLLGHVYAEQGAAQSSSAPGNSSRGPLTRTVLQLETDLIEADDRQLQDSPGTASVAVEVRAALRALLPITLTMGLDAALKIDAAGTPVFTSAPAQAFETSVSAARTRLAG